jgi:Fe2+ transport system protein FeoA
MQLSELKPGAEFAVSRVLTGGEIGKRLADMGFTEGAQGELVRAAFLRGPVQVRIRGYDMLIRRSEARLIEVAPRRIPKRRARSFLASLFSEPDCCAPSRRDRADKRA